MLSKEEKIQYSRQILMEEMGLEGQTKLKNTSVLVIGAGGLGCPLLQYLAAAGLGRIGIVDDDKVDVSNLHRQILFGHEDVGKNKAEVAKSKLEKNNPLIEIEAITLRLTSQNTLNLFDKYDWIVDGTDNFATRYLINDACVILGKAWVFGAIYKFEGQVAVFNYNEGASYRCLFPERPKQDAVPTCSQIGVLGVTTGLVGTLMASELIKLVTGLGQPLSSKMMCINLLSLENYVIEISRRDESFQIDQLSDYNDTCEDSVQIISVDELNENLQDFILVDVRTKEEIEISSIPHSVSFSEWETNMASIEKSQKVVFYCHFGNRSVSYAEKAFQNGYINSFSLEGGIDEWSQEIDSTITRY